MTQTGQHCVIDGQSHDRVIVMPHFCQYWESAEEVFQALDEFVD